MPKYTFITYLNRHWNNCPEFNFSPFILLVTAGETTVHPSTTDLFTFVSHNKLKSLYNCNDLGILSRESNNTMFQFVQASQASPQ